MPGILNKLKTQVRHAEATLSGKIVQIPKDVLRFNCPNHWASFNGKQVKQKFMITLKQNMLDFTCECGTIYKKI